MNGQSSGSHVDLAHKIARLVEERGWNQEDFVRISQLNRQTVRQILQPNGVVRRLRNATVGACAKALGLSVNELRNFPLEHLLARMNASRPASQDENVRMLYDQATQPELLAWLDRNPDRARQLTTGEIDELLSLQGTGGPLTVFGVEHYVELLERKRSLFEKIQAIAGTEFLDLLERLVDLMYDKVRPYPERR